MKKLSLFIFLFIVQLGNAQNWNDILNVPNNDIVDPVYRRGPIGVGFLNGATYNTASNGLTSILGQRGLVGHIVSGVVGDFNSSKWCGMGLGNPGGPTVFPYGFAAIDTGHLAFYNIIRQSSTRKDLIAGFGYSADNRRVDRFKIVHYNQSTLLTGKNILIANPRGAVGINAEPFAALSVDTRPSANGGVLATEPNNNGVIVKAIAIQGEQLIGTGSIASPIGSASAMGNQANQSLVLSGIPVEGLRAQLPAFDQAPSNQASIAVDFQAVSDGGNLLSPIAPAIPSPAQYGEITWQDLVFNNNVSTNCAANNSNKNFHISFRNGRTGTNPPGTIDPIFGNSFSALNKLPVATFTPRGRVGIGTTTPTCQVGVTPVFLTVAGSILANGVLLPSDIRFKKDIKTIENALDKIKALRGTTYTYDFDKLPYKNFKEGMTYGFIAQEVEKVIPEMAAKSDDGYYAVDYITLIPILTEAIKEQDQIVTDLKTEIEELKSEMSSLKNSRAENAGYKIYQNVPNPTSGITTVAYEITQPYTSASINLFDLNGRYVQGYDLTNAKGVITLSLENMLPGMYIYDLMIDGEQKVVKKLTLISRS